MADLGGRVIWDLDVDDGPLNAGLQRASSSVKTFSDKQKTSFQAFSVAVAGAGIAIGSFLKSSTQAYFESQQGLAQLNAVLASTGSVAGVTAEQATKLASSLQNVTGFSDEAILAGENLLLTFTNIGKETFPQATETVLDLSRALGQDVKSSAIQVGKALQDPILGVTALRRVGVNFNESAQKTIEAMVDTGHAAEAQKFILAELNKEFGNSARAYGQTLPGQIDILKEKFNDVQEEIGRVIGAGLAPLVSSVGSFIDKNKDAIVSMTVAIGAAVGFSAAIVGIAGAIGLAVTIIGGPFTLLLAGIATLLGGVVFKAVGNFQKQLRDTAEQSGKTGSSFIDSSKGIGKEAEKSLGGKAAAAAKELAESLKDIDSQIKKSNETFQEQLAEMIRSSQDKVKKLRDQLSEENTDFARSEADRKKSFDQANNDELRSHARKVDGIDQQIQEEKQSALDAYDDRVKKAQQSFDEENAKGAAANRFKLAELKSALDLAVASSKEADAKTLANLQTRLQQENEDFKLAQDRRKEEYDQDVALAKEAHNKKVVDTETQLNSELALQQKHSTDVLATKDFQFRDEITKLKESHSAQLLEFESQKQKAIKKAGEAAGGIAGAYNNVPNLIDNGALKASSAGLGQDLGSAMANGLKKAFSDTFSNFFKSVANFFSDLGKVTKGDITFNRIDALGESIKNFLAKHGLEARASGGPVLGGQPYLVGENGPEVFVPTGSGKIVPNDQLGKSNQVVNNVSINLGVFAGTPQELRTIGEKIALEMNRLSAARGAI